MNSKASNQSSEAIFYSLTFNSIYLGPISCPPNLKLRTKNIEFFATYKLWLFTSSRKVGTGDPKISISYTTMLPESVPILRPVTVLIDVSSQFSILI